MMLLPSEMQNAYPVMVDDIRREKLLPAAVQSLTIEVLDNAIRQLHEINPIFIRPQTPSPLTRQ